MIVLQTSTAIGWAQVALSAVLALATVVLAYATLVYTNQTKTQTAEMEKTRKTSIRPVLKGTVESWTNLHHRFTLKNTGNGAAHDVTTRWGFSDRDYQEEWSIPLISPGDQHNFMFPFGSDPPPFTTLDDLEEQLDEDTTLHFEAEYSDPLGNEYQTREDIPVLKTARSGAGVEQFHKDELKRVRSELEKIRKDIRKERKAVQRIQKLFDE